MYQYEWENSPHILTAVSDNSGETNIQTPEATYSDIPPFIPPSFLPYHHHNNTYQNCLEGYPLTGDSLISSSTYDPFLPTLPKPEPDGYNPGSSDLDRIGLNLGLGGRTYFSAADDNFLNRLYRRSRPFDSGSLVANSPKCQAEGCHADLSNVKHYHRRHKVCEFHSKAPAVVAGGLTQRFCQQCSRFHVLTEFDNGKRSCRRRLEDHNRRRRKSHQLAAAVQVDKAGNSSENTPGSPSHSVSPATMAVSPSTQESQLNCYNSPSASSSSIFY